MLPAFEDWTDALSFSAFLLLCMALPLLLNAVGLSPRAAVFDGISERAGPYIFTRHQLVDDNAPIDIAFVGSSVMKGAIDVDYVQARMSERFGPKTNVRLFPFVFQGFDLQYALIRDLLERRQVKVLVTTFSGPHRLSNRPHEQLHRFLRYGDYAEVYSGLVFADRIALFGSNVLGAPRQLLSLVRRDLPTSTTDTRRSVHFGTSRAEPMGEPAPAVVLGDDTQTQFELAREAITPREKYFAQKIAELTAQHRVRLVILNIPVPDDAERNQIWERADWRQLLPANVVNVGFKPTALFGPGVSTRRFYLDDGHVNIDGQICLTRSLTPFLLKFYESLN